ncbi:hypothetical protein GWL_15180 [Herbaspirillum sp. GW103]|nr:hypothetical protein GWL_15180 [Herbaspirillum sp. GW103]
MALFLHLTRFFQHGTPNVVTHICQLLGFLNRSHSSSSIRFAPGRTGCRPGLPCFIGRMRRTGTFTSRLSPLPRLPSFSCMFLPAAVQCKALAKRPAAAPHGLAGNRPFCPKLSILSIK